jgi:hypothetical protein
MYMKQQTRLCIKLVQKELQVEKKNDSNPKEVKT